MILNKMEESQMNDQLQKYSNNINIYHKNVFATFHISYGHF